jgi:hypothetical protein
MNMLVVIRCGLIAALLALSACVRNDPALLERIDALETRLVRQEDVEAIRRVAYSYGYFMDNALLDHVKALFADTMEYCEISGYGLYKGRDGCLTIWTSVVGPGLQNADQHLRFGVLIKHYMLKDVITVAPDGLSAEGRFDYVGYSGTFKQPERARQQLGVYRMGYTKENGIWKISRFSLSFDTSDFNHTTWANAPSMRCPSGKAPPPDAPFLFYHPFPETGVVPFHFPHPVTGEPIGDYVNPIRYWQGNWPGEFGTTCGVRTDARTTPEPGQAPPLRSAH